jgi:RES domain-containing protein
VITAWRLVDPLYIDDAFSGKGARLYGGRWNAPGTAIVYTASLISLATLELIVHVPRARRLPEYNLVPCYFHEVLVEEVDRAKLPPNWRMYPAPPELQELGETWVHEERCAVLRVPSAVIEEESNYLLNPAHEDFKSIDVGQPRPFTLDYRLLT